MAKNTHQEDGDYLSLPVPSGTVSGGPVRVGTIANGLNGVAETARGAGGNAAGYASVQLQGVHEFTVTLAGAIAEGGPVYITSANALNDTAASNALFGHAVKASASGTVTLRVRIAN